MLWRQDALPIFMVPLFWVHLSFSHKHFSFVALITKALAHTNRLFLPVSDPVVEFLTRTGITAAGGQFDFERCTTKMFVHRNRKRNFFLLLYLRRKYKHPVGFTQTEVFKQSSGIDRFRHVCKFQCSYTETDKPAADPAPGLSNSSPAR